MNQEIRAHAPRLRGEGSQKQLTEREWQILQHVMRGLTNKAIAKELAISHETVKMHVRHILAKFGVDSRVEAAVLGVDLQRARSARPVVPTVARTAVHRVAQGA